MAQKHVWSFFRAGGFDQVRIQSGADLVHLDELDQKLWVALACPTTGLEFDRRTLDLIDADKDGRIRAPELIAACKWAGAVLRNPDGLVRADGKLALSALDDTHPEGAVILASARQILANLGKADAVEITVADTADTARIFSQTVLNGDGIIPAEAAPDEATRAVVADVIACMGAATDLSGKPGIDQGRLDAFFDELTAFEAWSARGEKEAETLLPLGDGTAAAAAAVREIKSKVDDFFGRCRLAAYDPRAMAALNREEKEYLAIAARDLTITAQEVSPFPLAQVAAGRALPLATGINPAWAAAVARLRTAAVAPLLGDREELTETDWAALLAKLGPFECWSAGKSGAAVEKLGLSRVREILSGGAKESLTARIAEDKALAPQANAIASVDRLLHYQRDLLPLARNFVNFSDFYSRRDKAVFQMGTLYLDTRSCDLCLPVTDPGRHAAMAPLSRAYLAYIDCVRKASGEKQSIVAAFTDGDSDDLMVGRNGVFYDRQGRDWDATIAKIIENPISIRQAFWSPYKKLMRLIEEQVAKRAAAADTAANAKVAGAATAVANADQTKASAPPKPKFEVGTIAALGVAVGGITAALGALLQAFFGLGLWMPLGLIGIVILISGPSMVIAWLKLRQRNLGPLLDANGWAVNAKAKMNVPFGGMLTQVAKLPPGSHRDLSDPYAEPRSPWKTWVVVLIALGALWYFGAFEKIVPNVLPKSGYVERTEKQADEAKAAAAAAAAATNAPAAAPATP